MCCSVCRRTGVITKQKTNNNKKKKKKTNNRCFLFHCVKTNTEATTATIATAIKAE